MWFHPDKLRSLTDIRHNCEISDNLDQYGWLLHDGRTFGYQEIKDNPILLKTSFLRSKDNNNWISKIDISKVNTHRKISLIMYVAFDSIEDGSVTIQSQASKFPEIQTTSFYTPSTSFSFHSTTVNKLDVSYVCLETHGMHKIKEAIATKIAVKNDGQNIRYYLLNQAAEGNCSIGAVMFTFKGSGSIFMKMSKNIDSTKNSINPELYDTQLKESINMFADRFESTFSLNAKGFNQTEIKFAQAAMSNLIGGIGYFYGASKVKSEHNKDPVSYWKAPLYTAVPSRSFFPRGFLWDEGFHGLLISTWDLDISLDILMHWFDLMNTEGWIPREQILDSEALSKVPDEFVVQNSVNANPPTFFLLLKYLLKTYRTELLEQKRYTRMVKLYPRIQTWYQWFNRTQLGTMNGSYRWRGRNPETLEINPKTLTSGLDDFPRASHPDDQERHVDLYCWMQLASHVMVEFADFVEKNNDHYKDTYDRLTNIQFLDELHLSDKTNSYADYGLHTDKVALRYLDDRVVREVKEKPEYNYIYSSYGYVNLFPFLMELIPADSTQLLTVLTNIRDSNILWTEFGIRSLSKTSPFYMKSNTKDDPPYWRGQIWININYMILSALKTYSHRQGPYQKQAAEIYSELRQNVIRNMFNQYQATGYLWENYNDKTGKGRGCYPFTGWSALVVLIMAEIY
ncbi:uncharacterized protein LOC129745350 isoform X2 [Uranotaenia lowii]|nr:uncharacterized protein LOC129745350 isoform X2 [Uranotaenia lowii]